MYYGNDQASKIYVRPYDAAKQGAVIIYEDPDCSGRSGFLMSSTDPYARMMYDNADILMLDVHNDKATGVRLPYGYTVELYVGPEFNDGEYTVNGLMYTDPISEEWPCQNIYNFNDVVSSAIVYRNTYVGTAYGYWQPYTSTESITFTLHYGFTTSKSTEETMSEQYTLSMEMSEKITMAVEESEFSVSESFSAGISYDVQSSYSYDFSEEMTVTCSAKPAADGVGLWQWVTMTTDGRSKTFTA